MTVPSSDSCFFTKQEVFCTNASHGERKRNCLLDRQDLIGDMVVAKLTAGIAIHHVSGLSLRFAAGFMEAWPDNVNPSPIMQPPRAPVTDRFEVPGK